jgi:hypothetical protein
MYRIATAISFAILAVLTVVSSAQRRAQPGMRQAVSSFVASLDAAQKTKALLPFNSDERQNFNYVPLVRKGIAVKELTPAQREGVWTLLRASLSEKGFQKAETIRSLESVLREIEQGRGPVRDPELYYVAVFGDPAQGEPWGWRYEGHHMSLNWTVAGGRVVATSPQFLGSNPGEVRNGHMKGTRVLAAEEDLGRTLVKSLNEAQRREAVLSPTAPADITTSNKREIALLEDKGVAYGSLNKEQQGILLTLIQEYAGTQRSELARARLQAIRNAGLDSIKFAWMGGLDSGQGHYYRVQGKTFLIEYDNTQNQANHIHSVWRDFKGDFGRDLLAQHYRDFPATHTE